MHQGKFSLCQEPAAFCPHFCSPLVSKREKKVYCLFQFSNFHPFHEGERDPCTFSDLAKIRIIKFSCSRRVKLYSRAGCNKRVFTVMQKGNSVIIYHQTTLLV